MARCSAASDELHGHYLLVGGVVVPLGVPLPLPVVPVLVLGAMLITRRQSAIIAGRPAVLVVCETSHAQTVHKGRHPIARLQEISAGSFNG